MKTFRHLSMWLATTAAVLALGSAQAAEPLKIGLVVPTSGPYAIHGHQIQQGMKLFFDKHGKEVAGRQVQILVADDTGAAPDVAKRQSQELIVKHKVDILAGYTFTPNAFAVAPLATQANVPMVILNAATSSITEKSPNIVRVSFTASQDSWAIAQWAYDSGIRKVFTLVTDYGPGHDSEKEFVDTFKGLGGTIVDQVRSPMTTTDYSPYLQRVKDAKPDALFFFAPAGELIVRLVKDYKNRELDKAGIKLIGSGNLTGEDYIDTIGDAAVGMITAYHYAESHDSPENKAFVDAYYKNYPKERPNLMVLAGYDGMELIYRVLEKTGGKSDAADFMAAAKGMQWESPRGPVEIDPETRDIILNEYIRRVERVDGKLQNVEFDVYKAVKDPGKARKK